MFVKNTVVKIVSFHIAPTQPIAVISRKIKHKHIQKESTFPLPLITSLRHPQGGLPLETIQPLATRAEAWQAIPRVSNWVLGIIKQGYTLQHFTPRSKTLTIWQCGLHIGSVQQRFETVSPAQSKSGFYTLLVPLPQEGLWSKIHSRSQTSESLPL